MTDKPLRIQNFFRMMKATWASPVIKVLLQIACTADFRCVTFPEPWKNDYVCCRVRLCETPWTVAHKAPLFMELSRQEYWSGLPVPTPGHLPTQGLNPCLLCLLHLESEFFTTNTNWEAPTFKHIQSVVVVWTQELLHILLFGGNIKLDRLSACCF